MFDQQGLSLDQAPPVSVVFGLFLTGALFGLLSGIAILYFGDSVLDSTSAGAVIAAHLLSLGFAMSFMLGALFQMLPVIAGVILQNPLPRSNIIKALLSLGVLSLIAAFASSTGFLFLLASASLGASLLYVAWTMGSRLIRLNNHSASSRGMLYALLSLALLVLLALYLTTTYAQIHSGVYFAAVKQLHYSFALFGWMMLLIMSISFQTVEMFYVTPPYPKLLSRYAAPMIFAWLIITSVATLFDNATARYMMVLLYGVYGIYGIYTLIRLSRRKRPLTDATVWFWRIGMGSLVITMVLLVTHAWIGNGTVLKIAIVLFVSFVLSVIFSMFYKIVPFLTWFHLNAQGYFTAPMMHEVIHPKTAKKHLWIHAAMVASLLLSILLPVAIYLSGMLMLLSFGWVTYQILHANRLYRHTQQTGERFEMQMDLPPR